MDLHNNKQLWQVEDIYLTRWKCDECYRHIKQSYKHEDLRVMSYYAIRNIMTLVHCIAYYKHLHWNIHKTKNYGTINIHPIKKILWCTNFYQLCYD